jgi:hypothetical protein
MKLILFANLAVSWMLFSLIWVVQLTHYPAFRFVSKAEFSAFHKHHTTSVSYIVLPMMLSELALSGWLVFIGGWAWEYAAAFFIVIAIWVCTFLISVPLHNKLSGGKDEGTIRHLVNTNWLRTALWTLKAGWLTWMYLSEIQ